MGTYDELISHRLDVDALRSHIGADSLAFLSLSSLMKAIGRTDGYCNACFTGDYPIPVPVTFGRTKNNFEGVLR